MFVISMVVPGYVLIIVVYPESDTSYAYFNSVNIFAEWGHAERYLH